MAGCRAGAAESSGYGVAGVVCGCGGGSLLEQQPAIEAGGEVGVALARLSHHQLLHRCQSVNAALRSAVSSSGRTSAHATATATTTEHG